MSAFKVSTGILPRMATRGAVLLLMLATSLTASAQLSLAGNLSYSQTGYTLSKGFDSSQPKGMALSFSPQVGIRFNERCMAGIRLGVSNSIYSYVDGYYDRDKDSWMTSMEEAKTLMKASGALFLRLRCVEWERMSLHLEISGGYAYGMGASTKSQYRVLDGSVFKVRNTYNLGQIELKVVPVVTYELSSHFGMDLYVNLLSLAYRRTTTNYMQPVDITETSHKNVLDHTLTTSDFDIGIQSLSSDLLSIGLYYSF